MSLDWLEYDLIEYVYSFGRIFIISFIALMPAHALGTWMRGDKHFNFLNCLKIVFISTLLYVAAALIDLSLSFWAYLISFVYLYIKYFSAKRIIWILLLHFLIFFPLYFFIALMFFI